MSFQLVLFRRIIPTLVILAGVQGYEITETIFARTYSKAGRCVFQLLGGFKVNSGLFYFSSKPKSAPSKNAERARDTPLL